MMNIQICTKCNTENELFRLTCSNCKSYLRAKISNIDLWKSIWNLIENPQKLFVTLIQAQHKNFAVLLCSLIAAKVFLILLARELILEFNDEVWNYLFLNFLLAVVATLFYFGLHSFILKIFLLLGKIKSRFKDNFTILTFANIPVVITVVIFFPLEYTVFGTSILTFDPVPFEANPTPAYLFAAFEGLMFLWSFLLITLAVFVQSGKLWLSILYVIAFYGILYFLISNIQIFPFT